MNYIYIFFPMLSRIMRLIVSSFIFISLLSVIACSAHAIEISDLIGDIDGISYGVGDGITDIELSAYSQNTPVSYNFTHEYDLQNIEIIDNAFLEIGYRLTTNQNTGGVSIRSGSTFFGKLNAPVVYWEYNVRTIDLSDFLINQPIYDSLLSGVFSIRASSDSPNFIIDYIQLNVSGRSAPVPEPSTILLLGIGLLGLVGIKSRKKKG